MILAATQESIARAADRLRRGLLVAFPTETVYGLGARVTDREAVRRVFIAKHRPEGHPLIAHVLGEDDARALASEWPEAAHAIAKAFWPGPITVVVSRAAIVPDEVTGGGSSVAIRAPAHPVARALIEKVGEAIVAPSANIHQRLSPTRAEHVEIEGDVLVLDGGSCERGIESTVVDVRTIPALILRPGPIDLDMLRAAGIEVELMSTTVGDTAVRPSPGMSERHYAPRAQLILTEEEGADALDLGDDPAIAARDLYARLHELDAKGAKIITVRMPPDTEAWRSVRDRLVRASRRK